MLELLKRLVLRPTTTTLLLAASLIVNLLMLAAPLFVMLVLNRYVAFGVDGTLFVLASGAILAVTMELIFRWIRLNLARTVSVKADDANARMIGDVLLRTKLSALESVNRPLMRQITRDGEVIQSAYAATSLIAVLDVPFAAILFAALIAIDPLLAFIAFIACATMLLLGLVLGRSAAGGENDGATQRAVNEEDLLAQPAQTRAFDAREMLLYYWQSGNRKVQEYSRRAINRRGMLQALSQTLIALTTISVVGVGAMLVVRQELDIGVLIAANILAARSLAGVSRAAMLIEVFSRAGQAATRLKNLSRLPMENMSGTALGNYSGRLDFQDVTFAYPGATTPLFESLSFSLKSGEIMVVHGRNGAGKSSLVDLVTGLREPIRGLVLADGIDLRQVALPWWRRQISYLPQSPSFANVSIHDNLRSLNPEISGEGLSNCIKNAGARDLIAGQVQGLETVLNDNGNRFAPGERKRLGLARALTTSGRLVVFDEPLDGLDNEGRTLVAAVLQSLVSQGCTMVVCSSDPGIIKEAHWHLDLDHKPVPVLTKGPGVSLRPAAE